MVFPQQHHVLLSAVLIKLENVMTTSDLSHFLYIHTVGLLYRYVDM